MLKLKLYRTFCLFALLLTFSCSESNSDDKVVTTDSSYVIVNGIKSKLGIVGISENDPPFANKKNGIFTVYFSCGVNTMNHHFYVQITEAGKVISAGDYTDNDGLYQGRYYNYRFYPDYFVDVLDFSFNEQQKTFKLNLKSNLYLEATNMQSEYINTEMHLIGNYEVQPDDENYLLKDLSNNRLDYFNAKFNGTKWVAYNQFQDGSFTSYDPYKIVVKFNSSTPTANYLFTNSDTINCMKFYKFNTVTFQYEEFNVSGNVNLFYKEFHGTSSGISTYSFFGTFNLTATNPNDSSEVISVTDGKFRTLNPY